MSDLALVELERVDSFEREESRFEQKGSRSFYEKDWLFLFPTVRPSEREIAFDVSREAWHHGIQTTMLLSGYLYCHCILNGVRNPIKNVETLCHAFLYAVDCDRENSGILLFTVPGNGTPPYRVTAVMRGFRQDTIFLDYVN